MTSNLRSKALLLKRTLALGKRNAVLYSVLAAKHSLKSIACCIGSALSFAVAFSVHCDRTSTSELGCDHLLATLHVSFGNSAQAQIVPDNTLGIEPSVVTPVSPLSDRLDGGAIRGANLFHSFSQFNINEGRAAYFANLAGIENILSRVTGTNPSHIFGKLGVLGNANLFLLNPNGVIFGPNASLDISGSFVTTTANSIIFSDGTLFSATHPETQPLLTIKVPIGVQFGTNQPGAIINAGSLAVAPRQNLVLVGGTVVSTGQLSVPNGQLIVTAVPSSNQLPEHASLANSSLPQLLSSWDESEVTGLTLNSKGEVELTESGLRVDTGDVVVQQLTAGTATLSAAGNLTLVESQFQTTGNLNLLAGDTVRVRDSVAKPFLAQAGGNLYIQGNSSIDILALNHPETPFQSGGNLTLVSDGIISGDAHFSSGGDFSVLNLSGGAGNFISLYDPIISSQGNVMLANYEGASLKIEAVGDIKVENITITQPDTMLVGSDPDISILTSSPALILRAGVTELANPPNTGLLYTITDLGRGSGNDVNEQGQVALTSLAVRRGATRAALWNSSTGLQNLGTLPGDNLSRAYGINNLGQAIGDSYLGNRSRAVLWDSNGIQNLGTLPGTNESLTWDINDAGQVVGASGGRAVLWDSNTGTIQDLGALPGSNSSQARGINNAGQVVGFSGDRAVLWDTNTGSIQDLGTVDGTNASEAWNINEAGQVVGGSGNNFNTPGQCIDECSAFLWNSSTGIMQNLGTLPGGNFSRAWDINNSGQVVGTARVDGQPRGFLWQEGQIYDLNELILSGSGWDNLTQGTAINEAGQIVGDGEINGQMHAFLMTPIETSPALPGRGSISLANVETLGGPIILSAASDINAAGAMTSNGGNISLDSGGVINAVTATLDSASTNQTGNINLNARSIFLTQGTQISASTFGSAQGGNVTVNATETVELSGVSPSGQSSFLLAETLGAGNAGNIELNTRTLILRDGAAISASVAFESTGQGGKLTINSDSVELNGTSPNGQFPSRIATATAGSGKAGDMEINTSQLVIQGGAAISTATISNAPGGNLTINSDTVEVIGTSADGQLLSALSTDTGGAGKAGDLTINTEQLRVRDGAAVSSSTLNAGQGGNLIVNAPDFVELSGTANNSFASGLYAQAFADGDAGNLTIEAGELRIFDGAKVTVAAGNAADARVPISRLPGIGVPIPGQATGNAGNLEAKADLIDLNNRGAIIASTDSGEGGNINLEARDLLLMRHNSLISAEARGTGNGGNVTIDAQFVVGVPKENSDIIANAFQGNGGRVQITTQGIYGLQYRPRLTPLSDITASSTFGVDGVVEINAPDVDPSRGLVQLPTEPVNPQLDQRCQSRSSQATSRFVNTGRGGLPLSPEEISSNTVWEDLRIPSTDANHPSDTATVTLPHRSTSTQLVEAQGWIKLPDGRIILTTQASTATAYSSSLPVTTCGVSN